jgi:hypothetical protein
MSNKEIPFFTQSALIDRYAHTPDLLSDSEAISIIVEAIQSSSELSEYFFRSGPTSQWAPILLKHSFFSTPPTPIATEKGTIFPRWFAQDYLIQSAKDEPDVVIEHIKNLEAEAIYLERAIVALRSTPLEKAETVLPVILEWLANPKFNERISLEAFELMIQFAESERTEAAFKLFRSLTRPVPSSNSRKVKDILIIGAATSILPLRKYDLKIFHRGIASLRRVNINKTYLILEAYLCEALDLESKDATDSSYKDHSFWRSAIEDTTQDSFLEYKDILLVALRDTLEIFINENVEDPTKVIEKYLESSYEILRRLGIHLLVIAPKTTRELVAKELLNKDHLDDTGIHHEYFRLLKQGYLYLNQSEQEELMNFILSGPPSERLEKVASWVEDNKEIDKETYINEYAKIWIRDRLWMLRDYLPDTTKIYIDQLIKDSGEPEHPDFTHWTSGAYTVSYISPLTEEDVRIKTKDDLIHFLRNWHPNEKSQFSHSREAHSALGNVIAKVILASLDKYIEIVKEIVYIHPDFATSFLNVSLDNSIDPSALWDLRLFICEELLSNEFVRMDINSSDNGSWRNFRRSAVDLLENALKKEELSFPDEFLPRLKNLLLILINDPDPDMDSDRPQEGWLGHHDPLTVAINHIRPEAIYCLIRYAKVMAVKNSSQAEGFGPERMEPSVKAALTKKVNYKNDPSLAVHSVFGREINLLYWLDKNWVEQHIAYIFPPDKDKDSISFFVAAWDSYIVSYVNVYSEVYQALRSQYEQAIENVSHGYVTKSHLNPVRWLANHLILEFMNSSYDINSLEGQQSLLFQFFNKTLPDARGEAVWGLADFCRHNQSKITAFWPRAKNIWQWRLNIASAQNYSPDFKKEMIGFSNLLNISPENESILSLWPLLEGILPFLEISNDWDQIWHSLEDYLSKEIDKNPLRVIQFYRLMHDQIDQVKYYYSEEGRQIIEKGLRSNKSAKETHLLIDRITRKGNYEFKYLQDEHLR